MMIVAGTLGMLNGLKSTSWLVDPVLLEGKAVD